MTAYSKPGRRSVIITAVSSPMSLLNSHFSIAAHYQSLLPLFAKPIILCKILTLSIYSLPRRLGIAVAAHAIYHTAAAVMARKSACIVARLTYDVLDAFVIKLATN